MKQSALLVLLTLVFASCHTTKPTSSGDDGKIEVTLLQINDVYEISALEEGNAGGMARVATIRKQYANRMPTLLLHAGDFLSPSVPGTLPFNEKEKVNGRQMVEAMNIVGVDLVTFGNHEFDLPMRDVQARIDESQFEYVSSNVSQLVETTKFPWKQRGASIPKYRIKTLRDADGTEIRIGFFGVTLPSRKQNWLFYDDLNESAKAACAQMRDSVDVIIGITHQEIDDDQAMAAELQFVPLFIGGHDHNNMRVPVGTTTIIKADANAKSMYAHTIRLDKRKNKREITSESIVLNKNVPFDAPTQALVERWEAFIDKKCKEVGIQPKAKVAELETPLDGREFVVRGGPSELGRICAKALSLAAPESDFAVFNTGSIRVDDILTGAITEYDVLRILPYGGKIKEIEITGKLIELAIKTGAKANIGRGGYFALDKVAFNPDNQAVTLNGEPLNPTRYYRVALPQYLMTGQESGLAFLKPEHPEIRAVHETMDPNDLRFNVQKALIAALRK
jgi:2',3'-cyclic-nucleotide 2'-phosphodiesterase (5'-nucleotidase family)